MALNFFPTLQGIGWSVFKAPVWHTRIQRPASARERRVADQWAPRTEFTLTYPWLPDDNDNRWPVGNNVPLYNDLRTLMGFFEGQSGRAIPFLYTDPDENTATGQFIGTGDGVTTAFQMVYTVGAQLPTGGYLEPIFAPYNLTRVYFNGSPVSLGFNTLDTDTGILTFSIAPPAGTVITADFQFYYRCRFMDDAADFENFMFRLWRLKKLKFATDIPAQAVTISYCAPPAPAPAPAPPPPPPGGYTCVGASKGGKWDAASWRPAGGTTMTLTNNDFSFNLTGGGFFANGVIYSTTYHNTCKYYFEVSAPSGAYRRIAIDFDNKLIWVQDVGSGGLGADTLAGVANGAAGLQIGSDLNAVSAGFPLLYASSGVWFDGQNIGPIGTAPYWNNGSAAVPSDPATGVGGYPLTGLDTSSPMFIALETLVRGDNFPGPVFTIRTTANGFYSPVPATFYGW